MNFITADEFLKQSKEIQKVILDWWKPQVGDLIYDKSNIIGVLVPSICIGEYTTNIDKYKHTPLFSETQLRHFIEDKTGGKVDWRYYYDTLGYDLMLCDNNAFLIETFENLGMNLFQAYWKVAIKIAENIVNKNNDK